jgi:hypothetical protein
MSFSKHGFGPVSTQCKQWNIQSSFELAKIFKYDLLLAFRVATQGLLHLKESKTTSKAHRFPLQPALTRSPPCHSHAMVKAGSVTATHPHDTDARLQKTPLRSLTAPPPYQTRYSS